MTSAELLEHFGTSIAVVVALVAIGVVRVLSKQRHIIKALDSTALYLLLFLGVRIAMAYVPAGMLLDEDGDPSRLARAFTGVGLALVLLAGVRALPLVVFDYLVDRRQRRKTPRIMRDVIVAALYVLAGMVLLGSLFPGINVGSIVATAGVASLVLGLALQDTLGNVFAGLALQAERPFEPGDWITVGKTTGRVLEIDWRATKVIDFDEDVLVIPNSVIGRTELINHSRPDPITGQSVKINVSVAVPPSRVIAVLHDVLAKTPGVLTEPAPWARLIDFQEHAATYLLKFYTPTFERSYAIQAKVRSAVWYALRRADIEIPFPIRTIHNVTPDVEDPGAAIEEITADLSAVGFLGSMPATDLAPIAQRTRRARYGAGEPVIQEGETGSDAFFVVDGNLNVCYTDSSGILQTVATLGAGDHFGEMSALSGEPRTSTVVAETDVDLLVQDRETFALLLRHEGAAERLSEMLEQRRVEVGGRASGDGADGGQPRERRAPILTRLRSLLGLK